jgi:hypothetical protein
LFKGSDYYDMCGQHFEDVNNFITAHAIHEFGMRNPVRDATAGMVTNNMHRHISEEVQEEAAAAGNTDGAEHEAKLIAL